MKPLAVLVCCLLVGCGSVVPVPTQKQPAAGDAFCEQALATGTLVAHEEWGAALQHSDGRVTRVIWPHGYFARQSLLGMELVAPGGMVVARAGDLIEMGGGFSAGDESFTACPVGITRIQD